MAAAPASCDVPVVRFEDLVSHADLSAQIEAAFGYDGMGILAVSGVPELDAKRMTLLPLAFQFANLPERVKDQYSLKEAYYSFGWSHGKENLQGQPDFSKGSYYNNPQENDLTQGDAARIARYPSFFHPNIWPAEVPQLERAFMDLGQLIVSTGVLVARQCDAFIERKTPAYERGKLHRIISTGRCAKARLLHYFAVSEADIARQREAASLEESFTWCGWHNDHGALTGLVQAIFMDADGNVVPNPDPHAGLYVKNRRGEILKANIPPGHLIYQIGETAQILSGGVLQATPHAVRGPQVTGINRETLAVFMQPLPDEKMAIPGDGDPQQAGKTENLPRGVPPLLSRWNNSMDYDQFTEATMKAYY
jgi:isopenicillin N synthase-like dioxygenase